MQIHRKCRLVIGVENTPTWIFRALRFLVVDLGGVLGQIGRGEGAVTFTHAGVAMAPAICYEGLYGDFMGMLCLIINSFSSIIYLFLFTFHLNHSL